MAKEKKPRIDKIRKAIKQQLGHLKRNLWSIDALIGCGGGILAAGPKIYQKLLVISEMNRKRPTIYNLDSRSMPDRIVSLCQALIRPSVRGKARGNVEFDAKVSFSVTGEGFTFLDRLSYAPYNEGEDLKAKQCHIAAAMVIIRKRFMLTRSTGQDRTVDSESVMKSN